MSIPSIVFLLACSLFSFEFLHPFSAPKVGLLILLALILGRGLRGAFSWRHALLFCWALWPVLQITMPLDPLVAMHDRGLWLLYVLFAWLVWPLSEQHRTSLAQALGWAAMLASAYSGIQWFGWDWISWETPRQPTSFFGNPNFVGHFLLLAWFLARFTSTMWARWGYGLMALGICLSGSRAVIGIWLAILAVVALRNKRYRIFLVMGFLVLATVALFTGRKEVKTFYGYLCNPESYITQYHQQPELIADRDIWFRGKRLSLMTRVALYGNSLYLVKQHPWLGIGSGQFHAYYPAVAQKVLPDLQLSDVYRAQSVHQGFLELTILHGLPWALTGLGILIFGIKGIREPRYLAALISQLGLSLVSLNYQNPLIVVVLIMFWPGSATQENGKRRWGWPSALWLIPLLSVVGWDFFQAQNLEKTQWQQVSRLLPAHRAQLAFEANQFESAWQDQKRALTWDPHGPETIFNTGVIAWKLGEAGQPGGFTLAARAFLLNRALHPEYRPARDRLIEIKNAGRWQEAWSEFAKGESDGETHQLWLQAVFSWRSESALGKSLIKPP